MKKRSIGIPSIIYLVLVAAFLYAPILLILFFSFFGEQGVNFSTRSGFSFDSYAAIFTSDATGSLFSAIANTFIIAAVASVVSTILGSVSAIGIFHLGPRMKKIVNNVNQWPIISSEIVTAFSFVIFFATLGISNGWVRLILAHITFCTPYVVLAVMPRLYQMDGNVYEAALDLGATPTRALATVEIPMLLPGIISGAVMSFTMSLDDFIITQLNKGTTGIETLSTYLYQDGAKRGLEPFWFAVFSIIFVIVLLILLFSNLMKKSENNSEVIKVEKKQKGKKNTFNGGLA